MSHAPKLYVYPHCVSMVFITAAYIYCIEEQICKSYQNDHICQLTYQNLAGVINLLGFSVSIPSSTSLTEWSKRSMSTLLLT